jgi:hypothetical protein
MEETHKFELYKVREDFKTIHELRENHNPILSTDSVKEMLEHAFRCGFNLDDLQVIETVEHEYYSKNATFPLGNYINSPGGSD